MALIHTHTHTHTYIHALGVPCKCAEFSAPPLLRRIRVRDVRDFSAVD